MNMKKIILFTLLIFIFKNSFAGNFCISYDENYAIYKNGYNAIDIENGEVIPAIVIYNKELDNDPNYECYTTDHFTKTKLPYINISTINLIANIYNSNNDKKVGGNIYVVNK